MRRFAGAGVIAAIGHTNCTYDRAKQAIDAGATCSTHLFNAERPVNHREPGPIVALTEDERVVNELIVDGVHVHPAAAAFAVRACEGRVVLVTDALPSAASDSEEFMLGGLAVKVVDGVARLVEGGAIAGSNLTMDVAVRRAVHQVGMGVEAAFGAATSTPARMLGLADRGVLRVGAVADLCHMNDDLVLQSVWKAGEIVTR